MSLTLSPSEIRYSQDSILYKFSDGMLLTSTFARLISGQLSVTSLPAIQCVQKNGNWYAVNGNRRLYLYKKLQKAGVISNIQVSTSSNAGGKNFTTTCNGVYVSIRKSQIQFNIQEIISQWKRGEDVVARWGNAPVSPVIRRASRDFYDSDDFDDWF